MKTNPATQSDGAHHKSGYRRMVHRDAIQRSTTIFSDGRPSFPPAQIRRCSKEVQRVKLVNSVNQFYARDALNRMSERDV